MAANTTTYTLTDELFCKLTATDEWIHLIANPSNCCDSQGRHKYFRTVSYPVSYIVTESQIAKAKEMAGRRNKEIIAGIRPDELVFINMGMDYESNIPGEVCNHRIRCYFLNDRGNKYFIELIRGTGSGWYVDGAVDCEAESAYDTRLAEVMEHNRHTLNRNRHLPLPSQNHNNPFGVVHMHPGNDFTWDNVRDFINRHFGCSYTSARGVGYLLDTDDYVCGMARKDELI